MKLNGIIISDSVQVVEVLKNCLIISSHGYNEYSIDLGKYYLEFGGCVMNGKELKSWRVVKKHETK